MFGNWLLFLLPYFITVGEHKQCSVPMIECVFGKKDNDQLDWVVIEKSVDKQGIFFEYSLVEADENIGNSDWVFVGKKERGPKTFNDEEKKAILDEIIKKIELDKIPDSNQYQLSKQLIRDCVGCKHILNGKKLESPQGECEIEFSDKFNQLQAFLQSLPRKQARIVDELMTQGVMGAVMTKVIAAFGQQTRLAIDVIKRDDGYVYVGTQINFNNVHSFYYPMESVSEPTLGGSIQTLTEEQPKPNVNYRVIFKVAPDAQLTLTTKRNKVTDYSGVSIVEGQYQVNWPKDSF